MRGNPRNSMRLLLRQVLPVLAVAMFALQGAPDLAAQDQEKEEDKGKEKQQTAREIERLVLEVLADTEKKQDPFIEAERQEQRQTVTYQIQQRPRPQTGLGAYDIAELSLMAIWKGEDRVVAMMRSSDQKLFVTTVGDEAFDGRIVEISIEGKYVKFLQELKRVGPRLPGQPDVRYEPKYIRLRR